MTAQGLDMALLPPPDGTTSNAHIDNRFLPSEGSISATCVAGFAPSLTCRQGSALSSERFLPTPSRDDTAASIAFCRPRLAPPPPPPSAVTTATGGGSGSGGACGVSTASNPASVFVRSVPATAVSVSASPQHLRIKVRDSQQLGTARDCMFIGSKLPRRMPWLLHIQSCGMPLDDSECGNMQTPHIV